MGIELVLKLILCKYYCPDDGAEIHFKRANASGHRNPLLTFTIYILSDGSEALENHLLFRIDEV